MKYISAFILVFCFTTNAFPQDDILSIMKEKAEAVAHVKVLEIEGGVIKEIGVVEWAALVQVINPIKGSFKQNDKIAISFIEFNFLKEKELKSFEENKEYIVFLKKGNGTRSFQSDKKSYNYFEPIDHWVGILPYNQYLFERVTKYIQ